MDEPLETGLIGGVEKRRITILDYDENWPMKFKEHANKIRRALGGVALDVQHIGSTSVPGLGAKPIVDVLLVVEDSSDESSYLNELQQVGYQLRVREPDWHQHRMFRTPELDVHIHVLSRGCPEIQRYLTLRDRLRRSRSDRNKYESTKRELAARSFSDMNEYAAAKGDVIESILAAAKEEAIEVE